ncbi:hypothetical protein [Prosthecochloris sp.]|nr:hypothetical protein [Prosthecochloris sp.]
MERININSVRIERWLLPFTYEAIMAIRGKAGGYKFRADFFTLA